MTQVVVSDDLRDRLMGSGAAESVEVVDSSGKFVGAFQLAPLYVGGFREPTIEELMAIYNDPDPTRYTTEEVLAHLRGDGPVSVVWRPVVLRQLAAAYEGLSSAQQSRLADAVVYARGNSPRPHELGESRDPVGPGVVLRFWYEPPLGVWFFVSAQGVEVASAGVRPGR